jgi:hypothetical protein
VNEIESDSETINQTHQREVDDERLSDSLGHYINE